jgi:hypothetical protein
MKTTELQKYVHFSSAKPWPRNGHVRHSKKTIGHTELARPD